MEWGPVILPAWLSWTSLVLIPAVSLVAAWRAPWRRLANARMQHVYLGAGVVVLLLWTLRAGLGEALEIHLLGMTGLTLMCGWALALLAAAAVCMGLLLAGIESGQTVGLEFLCAGLVPVLVSWWLFRLVDSRLPNHLFVYLFLSVFAGAALATTAGSLLRAALLALADVYQPHRLVDDYLALIPLFALPEALLNGFIITLLVVFRPDWVITFDDQRYLGRKD